MTQTLPKNQNSRTYLAFAGICFILLVLVSVVSLRSTLRPQAQGKALDIIDSALTSVNVNTIQHITWQPNRFVASHLTLNELRRVAANPDRFVIVRTIADRTPNDGDAIWVPNENDVGPNIFIEIACPQTDNECHAIHSRNPIAVLDNGGGSMMGVVYGALEHYFNK